MVFEREGIDLGFKHMIEQETWLIFFIVSSAFSSMLRTNIMSRQCPQAYKMIIPYNHEPSIH